MNIQTHLVDTIEIAEVIADGVIVRHADDALDLMANLYYQGFDRMTR